MPRGNVRVSITADTKGLEQGLRRADRGLHKFSSVTKQAFLGTSAALGAQFGVRALFDFAGASIKTASDVNESLSKNIRVFGRHAKALDRWSKTTATAIGVSRAEALAASGTFGGMFKTIGLGQKPAADMSKRLVELAADMASFNNTSPEEALEALRSGLSGEAEPLRRFQVLLSETRVKQEAWKSGIAETGAELTEQQKVQARYNLILKDSRQAQGDFARTSGGAANQTRILKGQFSDLTGELGQKLLPVVNDGLKGLNKFVGEMRSGTGTGGEFAKTAKEVAHDVGAVTGAVAGFVKEHPNIVKVGLAMAGVGKAIQTIKFASKLSGLSTFMTAAKVAAGAFKRLWVRAGETAATEAGEAVTHQTGAAVQTRLPRLKESFGRYGKVAGRTFGLAAAAAAVAAFAPNVLDGLSRAIRKFNDIRSGKEKGDAGNLPLVDWFLGLAGWKPKEQKALGGRITSPLLMVGEEAPQHPEWVIATNPAYRKANVGYWMQAGRDLGVPGFAQGGPIARASRSGEVPGLITGDYTYDSSKDKQVVSKVPKRSSSGIVALGRWIQRQGYKVSEHPKFGGVAPGVHDPQGWHYKGGALDINADGRKGGEGKWLDRLNEQLQKAGWHTIWRAPGHYDHLHVDIGTGAGDSEQRETRTGPDRIAQIILSTGRSMGAPPIALVAAIEAGLVESGLQNLNYGDRDSIGVFQQRPSQGWGTRKQIMDPRYAARKFFEKAIPLAKRWTGTPGALAQAVQRSAFPGRYDERESEALGIIGDIAGSGPEFQATTVSAAATRRAERDRNLEDNYKNASTQAARYKAAEVGLAQKGLTPHRRAVWERRARREAQRLAQARGRIQQQQIRERNVRRLGEPNYEDAFAAATSDIQRGYIRSSAIQYYDQQIARGRAGQTAGVPLGEAIRKRAQWGDVGDVLQPPTTEYTGGTGLEVSGPSAADIQAEIRDLLKGMKDTMDSNAKRWAAADRTQEPYRSLAKAVAAVAGAELGWSAGMGSVTPSSAGTYARY